MLKQKRKRIAYNIQCIMRSEISQLVVQFCQSRMLLFTFTNTRDWSPFVKCFLCPAEYNPATEKMSSMNASDAGTEI